MSADPGAATGATTGTNTGPGSPRSSRWRSGRWPLALSLLAALALYFPAGLEDATPKDARWALQLVLLLPAALIAAWCSKKLPQAITLVLSTLLCVVAVEFFLRRSGYRQEGVELLFRYDEELGWAFEAGKQVQIVHADYKSQPRINRDGFRDREWGASEPERLVAVVGDSFTSNLGVPLTEVFTSIANQRLPELSLRNHGVNGYGQVQELSLVQQLLERERPERVLLVLYVRNDFDDNLGEFDWGRGLRRPRCELTADGTLRIEPRVPPPMPRSAIERLSDQIENLRLVGLVKGGLQELRQPARAAPPSRQPPELRYCLAQPGELEQRALRVTEALLAEFQRACLEGGARFGIVIAPTLWQVETKLWTRIVESSGRPPGDYVRDAPQEWIRNWCAEAGVPCLDLLPLLEEHTRQGEVLYYPREQHWNSLGNRRVGEALSGWIPEL